MAIEHAEGAFEGSQGIRLYYQNWRPEQVAPRAVIVISHGFGEHSGRYGNVVRYLVPRGYTIYALDHRGHGRSPGRRGHINRWAEYREDLRAFVSFVKNEEPGFPLFLYGHSMGGLIALEYVLRYPEGLRGVVASAPLLGPPGVSRVLTAMSHIASRIWPSFSLRTGGDAGVLSRAPGVIAALEADPLAHGRASARLGTEITAATAWTQAHAPDLRVPVLLLHGTADRLTPPAATRRFFENVRITDKELYDLEGVYHEPHNDLDHEQVLASIEGWIQRHL